MNFEVKGREFLKDGRSIKIISAAVHYFRNLPDTWDDIFAKLRALGCNCVETYCAWNMHEKVKGEFDFSGALDVGSFIKKAAEYSLMVIVRPGPYICAEWEFGGLPWWLQAEDNLNIRCMDERYIEYFDRYLDRILGEIAPHLCTNGGNVIMLQCENEYGYYGDDKTYLEYLRDGYRRRGIDVPLFTADGSEKKILLDGCIDGCLPLLNFGSRAGEHYGRLDELFGDTPRMVMEMWNGWFDEWEDDFHHTTSVQDYVKSVDEALSMGSINMYMFIGGTNFGFMNGANHGEKYCPHVTSYDYDALLTEAGDITPKYMAIRDVIKKYTGAEPPSVPANRPKKAFGRVELCERASLFDNMEAISEAVVSKVPMNMEKYGIGYGYIAYVTTLGRDYDDAVLSFDSLGDRAQVYVNRTLAGIAYINESLEVTFSAKKGDTLTILCENMGRTNFGTKMMRKKGIDGRCMIDGKIHFDWTVYPLPMDNLQKLSFDGKSGKEGAVFARGCISIEEPCDTFLRLNGFTKGFATLNGFNLGRHWCAGPQRTLFVPKSLFKKGENEIIVFDSDGIDEGAYGEFTATPELGGEK